MPHVFASHRSRTTTLIAAWACCVTALVLIASPGFAGKDPAHRTIKVGDQLVRLTAGPHDVAIVEGIAAGGAPTWHAQVPVGGGEINFSDMEVLAIDSHRLLVGQCPTSLIDVTDGTVKWTQSDNKLGTLDLTRTLTFAGDRFLSLGSRKSNTADADMGKDPRITVLDLATGKVLWTRDVDPHEKDIKYGSFWERYNAIQTRGSAVKERRYETHVEAVLHAGSTSSLASVFVANQVLVVGNHVMGIAIEDGRVLWEVKDGGGVLAGVYGHFVFMRYGDELRTYDIGSGAKGWALDLTGKGATVYSRDDCFAKDMTPPDGMDYLLISEHKVVSRVDPETGKATWTVDREGNGWFATRNALVVYGKQGATAYDYAQGKQVWTSSFKAHVHPYGGGDVVLFVDRGEESKGVFKGPYALWAVRGTDGSVVWSKQDVGGRKITEWKLDDDGVVTLTPDKGLEARIQLATGADAGGK